ncbi:MAG: Gfo/Idh/MocA family oxidoreductase, partial [Candidatus Hydrogenedentes bacterium]|nr:Gfo/Idh/MocA family oxidoreductase [Candidatus Hydrogenedentota bacterium]
MSKSKSLSRRTFLAASTAPLILTSCVTANGKRISPNDKIQVSYIGVGRRARQLMNLPPDCATVAYSDVNTSRLAEMKKNNPDARIYQDYREMLEQPDIDAVVVASPDHWHAIHSVHAMEAGK